MDTDQILNIALGTVVGLVVASLVTFALSYVIPDVNATTDTAQSAVNKALTRFTAPSRTV